MEEDTFAQIKSVVDSLQYPITDLQILLSLLCRPLDSVGLLPPQWRRFNLEPLQGPRALDIAKAFPPLQRVLIEHVLPTWSTVLADEGHLPLADQYFCPDAFAFALSAAGNVVLCAYSTLLSSVLTEQSIRLLAKLSTQYPIDRLHTATFAGNDISARKSVRWDDCLRNVSAVPLKAANAVGTRGLPLELELATYFNGLSTGTERLVFTLSSSPSQDMITSATQLLMKLVNVGVFPSSSFLPPSQPSFFRSTLATIRARFRQDDDHRYSKFWTDILLSLPSTVAQQTIFTSLCSSLVHLPSNLGMTAQERGIVVQESMLLRAMFGMLQPESDAWNAVLSVMLTRDWKESHARIFVSCVAGAKTGPMNSEALQTLLACTLDVWCASEHYITSLLLLIVSYFPRQSEHVVSTALSPSFVAAVGRYIGHLDNSVRRCGMLAAEVVATRAGKNLDFGNWEGDEDGKPWARDLRALCSARDIDFDPYAGDELEPVTKKFTTAGVLEDAEISALRLTKASVSTTGYDSDDSLTGYASPTSSRSASPTPSELDELEKDPTLRVGVKKISRPVYLAQLGELVRSTMAKPGEENQEVDKIEIALNVAEELIRKKRDYGTELEENAANLIYGFTSLNDNYELEGFENKRQRAVNALVACCPRVSATCIIEEFFSNQYSTEQRFVILNAVVLGARELASLPVHSANLQPLDDQRTAFPSKTLPPALHQKYLTANGQASGTVQGLLEGVTRAAIDRGKEATADKVPEFVRERQLRVRRPLKISEVSPGERDSRALLPGRTSQPHRTAFIDVAADYFIMPFINRFWAFLRNEQMREERTAHRDGRYRYHGAGTVLSQFMGSLALLVHAAQNAPQWLSLIAPGALELAVALGTRPISRAVSDDTDSIGPPGEARGKEASVLTAALELSLIVLDGCLELDGGRSLGLEHTALLLGAGEWAGKIFELLEKGTLVEGGGGLHEVRLRRAAAGVLLKVDELTSKWRRSMVDVR
ncbi:telomere length regulation protein-domain-containing protein [Suillus paluster]|uniref:telomere length regulation protein-domain-containing protein n=1 Tax=Suillus paluster TaxID=48578 RepID=UPI001B8647F0|nr:telomere length regulation protein-domain-containing protein [Suillus paluster]KAG1756297.1 telomere length regulation protein-domain-containing protein [Suillus paluster]